MVAIVSGQALGLSLGSAAVLGQAGVGGAPEANRSGEQAWVNIATGNLVVQDQDERLVARGQDIAAVRTYNSQGVLNDAWRFGAARQRIELIGTAASLGSRIVRTAADGAQASYQYDAASARYVSTDGDGAHDYFTQDSQAFVWHDGSRGDTEHYERAASGRLLHSLSATGARLSYSYDTLGRLASVQTTPATAGEPTETVSFAYVGNTQKLELLRTSYRNADGVQQQLTRVRYEYDTLDRLKAVVVDLSPEDNAVADGKTYRTFYEYDGNSQRITAVVAPERNAMSTASRTLNISYVQVGTQWRVASLTDGAGTTTFSYDTVARRTTVNQGGQLSVYSYDEAGQLTRIEVPGAGGSIVSSSRFEYDAQGNVTRIVDGAGRAMEMEYDAQGNQIVQRGADGSLVTRRYDERNLLVSETLSGLAVSGSTSRQVYDGQRQLRFVISAEGRVTEHRYDAQGQRVATLHHGARYDIAGLDEASVPSEAQLIAWVATQALFQSSRTDYAYDWRGQLSQATAYAATDATGTGVANGSHSVTRYIYDQAGQLLQSIAADGALTRYTYDGLGRVLSATDASGRTSVTTYADAQRTTTVLDPSGVSTIYTYDTAGRLTSVQERTSTVALGPTTYAYDGAGRLFSVTSPTNARSYVLYDLAGRKAADIDTDGSLTEYRYDASGRLTRTIAYARAVNPASLTPGLPVANVRPPAHAGDVSQWQVYDEAGRLTASIDATGAVVRHEYDGAGRLIRSVAHARRLDAGVLASLGDTPALNQVIPAGDPGDRNTQRLYDGDGLLRAEIDAEGALVEYRYDAQGRETRRIAYATVIDPTVLWAYGLGGRDHPEDTSIGIERRLDELRPASHPHDQHTVRLYDGLGRQIGEVDAEGHRTEWLYTARGQVERRIRYATSVQLPAPGQEGSNSLRPPPSPRDQVHVYTYTLLGQVDTETDPEGTVTAYAYDTMGRVVSTTRAQGSAEARTVMARYDAFGRLSGELSAEGAARIVPGMSADQINAVWRDYGLTHTYDAAGRRLRTTDALGQRTVYFYDTEGKLLYTVDASGGVQARRYNALDQLTQVIQFANRLHVNYTSSMSGGVPTPYERSLLEGLANASRDASTSYTYTLTGQVSAETDALGALTLHDYDAFGQESGRTAPAVDGATVRTVYEYDRRGQLRATVADATGLQITERQTYDAFGRTLSRTDAQGQRHTWQYDRLGRQIEARDPRGALERSSYDAFDRVLTQTDALGHTVRYAYDDARRSLTFTSAEGVSVTTTRTRHGQTHQVTDGSGQTTTYEYDRNGRLTATLDALQVRQENTYDRAGWLYESRDGAGRVVRYTYDGLGRMLTRTVDPAGLKLVTTYEYDGRGQQVASVDANGTRTVTTYDPRGQVLTQAVDPSGLNLVTAWQYDARGQAVRLTDAAGTVTRYEYDALGRRTAQILDPAGLAIRTRYEYDATGQVIASTDANGERSLFLHDEAGRLIATLDPLGQVVVHAYDEAGRPVRTTALATPIERAGLPAQPTWAQLSERLHFDAAHDAVQRSLYDDDGRLQYTLDGVGALVEYRYDGAGRVTERIAYATAVTDPEAVGTAGWTPPADAARDQHERTVYDAVGRAIYQLDATGAVVAQRYDNSGLLLQRTAYARAWTAEDGPPLERTAEAVQAAIAELADPAHDQVTRLYRDAAGRVSHTLDGTGALSSLDYDKNGNVLREIRYATPVQGLPETVPTPAYNAATDRVSVSLYDRAGRLNLRAEQSGLATFYTYDRAGRLLTRTEHANPAAANLGALSLADLQSRLPTSLRPSVSALLDRTHSWTYDAAGRAVLATDAMGQVTQTRYDAMGHATSTTAYAQPPAGTQGLTLAQALALADARTTVRLFDAAGRQTHVVDAVGHATRTDHDALGRVVGTLEFEAAVDPREAGWSSRLRARVAGETDRHTTFDYDGAGRLVSSRDAMGAQEHTVYDALGLKTRFTNKKGASWDYEYDAAGRLLRETSPEVEVVTNTVEVDGTLRAGTAQARRVVTAMSYDALGQLRERTEAQGLADQRTTRYEYDAAGRQVRVTYPALADSTTWGQMVGPLPPGGQATPLLGESPYSLTRYNLFGEAIANRDVMGAWSNKLYDRSGRILYEVDAEGYVTGYERNRFGDVTATTRYARVTTLAGDPAAAGAQPLSESLFTSLLPSTVERRTVRHEYDRMGRLTSITEPEVVHYDAVLNGGSRTSPITRYRYNAFGERVAESVLVSRYGATERWEETVSYRDALGREVARVDALGYLTRREYDAMGQLKTQTEYANALGAGQWNAQGWGTPAASADDRAVSYAYDRLGRLTRETRHTAHNGEVLTRYGYDALGNPTFTIDALGGKTYSYYDALGRVTAVAAPMRRAGAEGTPEAGVELIALTQFKRDAHGNVTVRIDHHEGAQSADAQAYLLAAPVAASAIDLLNGQSIQRTQADRVTTTAYDAHGHAVAERDAMGATSYSRYDAAGRLTRQWREVGAADGTRQTIATDYAYDRLGREVSRTQQDVNSVLHRGVQASVESSMLARLEEDGYQIGWSGENRVKLDWTGLVDPVHGAKVRVTIQYETLETSRVVPATGQTTGQPSVMRARTVEFDVGAVLSGTVLSWRDPNDANQPGGVSRVVHVLIEQGAGNGTWVALHAEEPHADRFNDTAVPIEQRQVYNAYGELIQRGLAGSAQQEVFKYDTAGRLWFTNAGDGVERVMLYDLRGQLARQEEAGPASQPGSLASLNGPQLSLSANTRATEFKRDLLGRVVEQLAPERDVYGALGNITDRVSVPSINFNVVETAKPRYDESSHPNQEPRGMLGWTGKNRVQVNWGDLFVMGDGPVTVRLHYRTAAGVLKTRDEVVNGARMGAVIEWPSVEILEHGGIATVDRVEVIVVPPWAADGGENAQGQVSEPLVFSSDRTPPPVYVVVPLSTAGDAGMLEMRVRRTDTTPAQEWQPLDFRRFGDALVFDTTGLGAGTYVYQVVKPSAQGPVMVRESTLRVTSPQVMSTVFNTQQNLWGQRPSTRQSYDRWGNVLSVSDARNAEWVTSYTYDWGNRQLSERRPMDASILTPDLGTLRRYDALGRLVSMTDGNGHETRWEWNAAGQLVAERHADGGVVSHVYDALGNRVKTTDAMGHATDYVHDALGRQTHAVQAAVQRYGSSATVVNAGTDNERVTGIGVQALGWQRLVERHEYDEAGRRIAVVNGNAERTEYGFDARGHVISTTVVDTLTGQRVVRMQASYDAYGRQTAQIDGNGLAGSWVYDAFGRLTTHTDVGGASYRYTYNGAGQLATQTNSRGQNLKYTYDRAGQLVQVDDLRQGQVTKYLYDLAGHKVMEQVKVGGVNGTPVQTVQDNRMVYNSRGQLQHASGLDVSASFAFDAVGNRVRQYGASTVSELREYQPGELMSAQAERAVEKSVQRYDQWSAYDEMNRMTVQGGQRVGTEGLNVQAGSDGHTLAYDLNGNRIEDRYQGPTVVGSANGGGGTPGVGEITERYRYDALNRLETATRLGNFAGDATPAYDEYAFLLERRLYDGAGRVVQSGSGSGSPAGAVHIEGDAQGITQVYIDRQLAGGAAGLSGSTRLVVYDGLGQQHYQREFEADGARVHDTVYQRYDGAGNLMEYMLNGRKGYRARYDQQLQRYESITPYKLTGQATGTQQGHTLYRHDANGYLVEIDDLHQQANDRTLVNDVQGRVIQTTQAGQVMRQWLVDGQVMGQVGRGVDPLRPRDRRDQPNLTDIGQLDPTWTAIGAGSLGMGAGRYVVQPGDSLQGIAQQVYGDTRLWWKLAQANGISSDAQLVAGQALSVPVEVSGTYNADGSFKPYDPMRMVGDTTPYLPPDDGGFLSVLIQVIMIVVTVYVAWQTGVWVDGAGGSVLISGAVGGAAGSVAGQVVAMAGGLQDGFDWKAVAMAAIGGGVAGGMGWALPGTDVGTAIVRGALSNALTQGIGVATGLQRSFNWAGVAASGVGAGLSTGIQNGLLGDATQVDGRMVRIPEAGSTAQAFTNYWGSNASLVAGTLSRTAGALASTVVRGGRVDTAQLAMDAFGNLVADAWIDQSRQASQQAAQLEALRQKQWADNRTLLNAAEVAADPMRYQSYGSWPSDGYSPRQPAGISMAGGGLAISLSPGAKGLPSVPVSAVGKVVERGFELARTAAGLLRSNGRLGTLGAIVSLGSLVNLEDPNELARNYFENDALHRDLESANAAQLRKMGVNTQEDYIEAVGRVRDRIYSVNWSATRTASFIRGHAPIMETSMMGSGVGFVGSFDNGPSVTVYPADESGNEPKILVYPRGHTSPSEHVIATPIFEDGDMIGSTSYPAQPQRGWREFILWTPSESGVPPMHVMYSESIEHSQKPRVYENQLPENLAAEIAIAKKLGIKPITPSSQNFDEILSQGDMKYAVKPSGELLVIPKYANDGTEISHAVITGGKPVIAAGEVDIAGTASSGYFGLRITSHSGHYMNGNTEKQNIEVEKIAKDAFAKFGIRF